MQKRTTAVLAAALTAATVTLTSCSGESESGSSGGIKGVQRGGKSSSPTPTQTGAAKRPKVETPGYQTKFEGWESSNPKEQAVLNDGRERTRSIDAAVIANDPNYEAFAFYSVQRARQTGKDRIEHFTKSKQTLTGKARYYSPQVSFNKDKGFAVLQYCLDESKAYAKNRKTGKENKTPTTANSYDSYKLRLQKTKQGVWQTVSVMSDDGGCKP